MGFQTRRQGPQQAGPQHNASHNFTNNPGLLNALGQGTK